MNHSPPSHAPFAAALAGPKVLPPAAGLGHAGSNRLLARWNGSIARRPGLAGGVLFALTVLVFQAVLAGAFVFDDESMILENPSVTAPGHWRQIFFGSIWSYRGSADASHFYRPLQIFAYKALYRLVGANPVWFHLVLLAVYAGTVCAVFHLGRKLLRHDLAAFAGAALWGLHPLHVETAAWISGLGDACSALLVIVSFLLFLRAERERPPRLTRHALAVAAYFAALLFKELALCFPVLLLVYWFTRGGEEAWISRLRKWLPYVLATVGYAAIRVAAIGHHSTTGEPLRLSLRTVAAAVGILGQDAKLFVWPLHLSLVREFDLSASLRSPWPWLALLGLMAAFTFRKSRPLLAFLIAWWVTALLPCLDYRQIVGTPVSDRFSYLPSVGPCLAIALGALVVLPSALPRVKAPLLSLPLLLTLGILWALQDVRSVGNWRSEDALWRHAAAAAPDSAYAHQFRAMALEYQKGDLDGAAREYQAAIRITQASMRPRTGMIYECDLGLGRTALARGHTREAIAYFQAAIALGPNVAQAYQSLGMVYFSRGDYALAAQHFDRAVQVDPAGVESRFLLGTCWRKLGYPDRAAAQFHAAREVDPTYFQAYLAEAAALEAMGDKAGAARARREMPPP